MFYWDIFHPIHLHGSVNDGVSHTTLLEAIMTVKIEFLVIITLIQDLAMENVCTKFEKDPIRTAYVRVLTVVHPMIRQPKSYRGPL